MRGRAREYKRRVREKEKLNEEMQRRIEETKQEAYSHSQSMLHSTTRKDVVCHRGAC